MNPDDKLRRLYCFHDVCDIPMGVGSSVLPEGVPIDNAARPLNYDVSTIFVDIDSRNRHRSHLRKAWNSRTHFVFRGEMEVADLEPLPKCSTFKAHRGEGFMQKIIPHLWFDTEAADAAQFYTGIFKNSSIKSATTLDGTPSGKVGLLTIELAGQEFMLISAGPYFKFTPAISFLVACNTKEEVDYLWGNLGNRAR